MARSPAFFWTFKFPSCSRITFMFFAFVSRCCLAFSRFLFAWFFAFSSSSYSAPNLAMLFFNFFKFFRSSVRVSVNSFLSVSAALKRFPSSFFCLSFNLILCSNVFLKFFISAFTFSFFFMMFAIVSFCLVASDPASRILILSLLIAASFILTASFFIRN